MIAIFAYDLIRKQISTGKYFIFVSANTMLTQTNFDRIDLKTIVLAVLTNSPSIQLNK